ncbi:DotA/TraY family protein [Herbaspirillum sp. ST 5-3]|uniref:DotA/TraY family protein n=1 Tax=Oxalobacteraceae TaxID=75682 RepID=UPI0010A2C753|nr:DotA/TraY family protein [Herbaspirillum sp. ST 5-3]
MKNLKKVMSLIALGLVVSLMPMMAQAQAGDMSQFTPAAGSKAMVLLASIFGNLGTFGPSAGDPMEAIIKYFNSAVLIIGGLLTSYSLIIGIIGTAHDGEVLGKKLHSAWFPIRTAVGSALVLPVVGGGYCTMQLIVGWVIAMSIGMADKAWATFVSADNIGKSLSVGLVRQDSSQLGYGILKNYVCVEAMKKALKDPDATWVNGGSSFSINKTTVGGNTVYQFGDQARAGFKEDACGTITVLAQQDKDVLEYPVKTGIWSSPTSFAESKQRLANINAEQLNQLSIMMGSMQSQAQSIVNGGAVDPAAIDAVINKYELAVRDKATSEILAIDEFKQVSENASQDGFVGMANFYVKMASLNDLIQRSMAKVPTTTAPTINGGVFKDQYIQSYNNMMAVITKSQRGQAYGISFESGGSNNQGSGFSVTDMINPNFNWNLAVKSLFTGGETPMLFQPNEHPLMALKRIGNSMLSWAGAGYASGVVAMVAGNAIPGIGGGVTAAIGSTIMLFVPMLSMGGFICSFLIPFTPTILLISAIIGWIVMCVEAIIIAPVWAVMHLAGKGDDMVGSGAQGYRLLLNLILKPTLLVFGTAVSIILLPIMGNYVAAIFNDTFISLSEDSNIFVMLTSTIFASVLYGIVTYSVIKRIFNLIHEIPDSVLKWVTNSGSDFSSSASQMNGAAGASALASGAIGMATNNIGNTLSGGLKNLSNKKFGEHNEMKKNEQKNMEGSAKELERVGEKHDATSSAINKNLGSNGSNIVGKALANIGKFTGPNPQLFNSLEGQQIQSTLDKANHTLGGKDTSDAEAYRENLVSNLDEGMSFGEAHQKAFSGALDEKFGAGSADYLSQASDGSLAGSDFTKGVEQLKSVHGFYQAKGLSPLQIKDKIGDSLNIVKGYAEKNNVGVSEAMDTALEKMLKK